MTLLNPDVKATAAAADRLPHDLAIGRAVPLVQGHQVGEARVCEASSDTAAHRWMKQCRGRRVLGRHLEKVVGVCTWPRPRALSPLANQMVLTPVKVPVSTIMVGWMLHTRVCAWPGGWLLTHLAHSSREPVAGLDSRPCVSVEISRGPRGGEGGPAPDSTDAVP